ncbi:MAG: hypothetical protein WBE48_17880, partial [Xanthobacteraceae bacterium]
MQVIHGSRHIKEEGIAAPARKDAVVAGLRYSCLRTDRYRSAFEDNLPAIIHPRGVCTRNAPQRCGLPAAFQEREAHPLGDISNGIAVRI